MFTTVFSIKISTTLYFNSLSDHSRIIYGFFRENLEFIKSDALVEFIAVWSHKANFDTCSFLTQRCVPSPELRCFSLIDRYMISHSHNLV